MTKKLYLEEPYTRDFSAQVVEQTRIKHAPGIILDQTAFYPTSGGQPNDLGTLNNISVFDVFENDRQQIVHILEKPLDGDLVQGSIDWRRRFDHMQQHTGQHLLSQVFLLQHGAETLSFHLGDESSTLDIDIGGLNQSTISALENIANRIIYEDRPIVTHTINKEDLHRFPVRKTPTVENQIRIVEIKDFDYSPCGGTHCSATGEIGILKISRFENYKGGTRIHFKCGMRALKDYQDRSETLKQLAESMSTSYASLPINIQRMQQELRTLHRERDLLQKKLLEQEALSLFSDHQKNGRIHVLKNIFQDRDHNELKIIADKIVADFPDTVILFGVNATKNARLFFRCSEELPCDMAALMKKACEIINGRGGGQPHQAQGGGPDVGKLEMALQAAEDQIITK
jgi:alanyl-tRNA synthetase